ncbi:MAG TPA: hypothetical protein PKA74_08130 [Bauldia sp.]|nr:hypothetical protein [Bauldia sp.]
MAAEKEFTDNLEKIKAEISALTETVSKLVSDTAGMQATLKKKVNSAAKQATAMGEDLVSDAVEMGNDAIHAAARTAYGAIDNVETQIARNPMTAVLVALGIGFAVGLVTRK